MRRYAGARLLLAAATLAALEAAARADGIPLNGDPSMALRAAGPNPCTLDGEALDVVQVRGGWRGARLLVDSCWDGGLAHPSAASASCMQASLRP